jgi:hypothetical protein
MSHSNSDLLLQTTEFHTTGWLNEQNKNMLSTQLVSGIKATTQTEGVAAQDADRNIWTYQGRSDKTMQKTPCSALLTNVTKWRNMRWVRQIAHMANEHGGWVEKPDEKPRYGK